MRVEAYFGNFKYEGVLLKEDDITYYIHDRRDDQIVRLPKSRTVLKFERSLKKEDIFEND